ncbi:methyltransferase [Actinospica durhamensis]|uniref:Methyltransferase n=1 Tax=Actinospica durhamensis TaxID=1508375 RepID=A0A941ILT4_9ACTN|nr:methyltransferase [Actinospica durhamensis]MBR7833370.1 methyltransferase [Actinospica durhamensis]
MTPGPDAADDYVLRHLADEAVDLTGTTVVFGDRTGELVQGLIALDPRCRPVLITDSYLAGRTPGAQAATQVLTTQDEPPERIDVLVVRVPKSLALLEDQLYRLAPRLHQGSIVVGTGKSTEIHTSTLTLFEKAIGPTRTSLAVRKARLIFATPEPSATATAPSNPWPLRYALPVDKVLGPVAGRTVVNHAGVFCADHLDIGTRFMLENLPTRRGTDRVVDLGCGNGVLGLAAALANPAARLTFLDESFPALASARASFAENVPVAQFEQAEFLAGDATEPLRPASVDLVLNNPPFHSHRATSDETAWRMFTGARRVLRPGGELWVVANRHLGYHGKLRRVFGNCDTVAGNAKFVILRATAAPAAPARATGGAVPGE